MKTFDPMTLREQFFQTTGDEWKNSQGEPDRDYIRFLENKLSSLLNQVGYALKNIED